MTFHRERAGEGIHFSSHLGEQFKIERIHFNLLAPIERGAVSRRAIVPFLLRKSGADYPDFQKLNEALADLYGAELSADVRKIGDQLALSLSLSTVDSRYALGGERPVVEGARLILSLLLHPKLTGGAFDPADFAVEQQALRDEIASEQSEKRGFALSRLDELMFPDHGFGQSRWGTAGEVEALTAADACASYRELLRTAPIEIIYLGCDNADALKSLFTEALAPLGRAPRPLSVAPPPRVPRAPVEQVERFDVRQSKYAIGFKSDIDYRSREALAATAAAVMYGGKPVSMLFKNVRERLSLCYYCAARYDRIRGTMVVDCGIDDSNRQRARDEILRQLELVRQGDFTDSEFTSAVRYIENLYRSTLDTLTGAEMWYLTRIVMGNIRSPQDEIADLLAVTRDEAVAAFGRLQLDATYYLTGKGALA